jgi:glyoxylase-like metal-dependent hydrolase (beta-lactamase superfamily II)
VEIAEIRPHLWRWTAAHPDWTPEEGGPGGWEQEVASFALVEQDTLVLFDPLVPADEDERFWRYLDVDVEHHGPPNILLTINWHARSAQTILDRYPAAQVWSSEAGEAEARKRVAVTRTFSPGSTLPADIEAHPAFEPEEAVFWLPSHRALVIGDALLGTADGGVRVPDNWFPERLTPEAAREALRPLLSLPVELVLPTHGKPVLENGREALEQALRD